MASKMAAEKMENLNYASCHLYVNLVEANSVFLHIFVIIPLRSYFNAIDGTFFYDNSKWQSKLRISKRFQAILLICFTNKSHLQHDQHLFLHIKMLVQVCRVCICMLQWSYLETYIDIKDGVKYGHHKNGKTELCLVSLRCQTNWGKLDYSVTICYKSNA